MRDDVHVTIQRQGYTEFGTLGRLTVIDTFPHGDPTAEEETFTCLSAENPDRGNTPGISCIPEGDYRLVRTRYNRGEYACFEIRARDGTPIPGRSLVKIHHGNTDLDVQGCVVLGTRPTAHRNHWGVGPSGNPTRGTDGGFVQFMKAMDGVDSCALTIYYRKG